METYRKVIIKDKNDLPTKSGDYDTNIGQCKYNKDDKNDWLTLIDWYLLPVEQEPPKEVKSTEEMLNKDFDIVDILNEYTNTDQDWLNGMGYTKFIDPMDYHKIATRINTQFQTEQRQVTDEEENKLVELYLIDSFCIANICDEVLDRSGALLGRIRDKAIAMYDGKIGKK